MDIVISMVAVVASVEWTGATSTMLAEGIVQATAAVSLVEKRDVTRLRSVAAIAANMVE